MLSIQFCKKVLDFFGKVYYSIKEIAAGKVRFVILHSVGTVALAVTSLVFAGVLMFVTRHNEWVLCLTIAAILELYTAFRIPSELEKEK